MCGRNLTKGAELIAKNNQQNWNEKMIQYLP